MNYKQCQYCGKSLQKAGLGPHEKHCKEKPKPAKLEQPVAVTPEYIRDIIDRANAMEEEAKELKAFASQLENFPVGQLNGYVLMIAKKA